MTPFQLSQQESKEEQLAAMKASRPGPSSGARRSSTNPGDGVATPDSYQLPEVQSMTIYREGEGNDKKWYTCGPSATRNMVAAMYERKYGAYKDFGEHQFELWEGTTTSGTSRANVAATLNTHFSSYGHWTTSRPATPAEYLNIVKLDTYVYHQSMIANIDTEYLPFFAGHPLNHFDFVYGYYDYQVAHNLRIGEEWDPQYIFGSSTYNPYGHQHASLGEWFNAIDNTAIHGIVS